ncbi:hypothetical protein SASPL_107741 [Salvia splendens]|uniref:YdbS-like PH domain-containing protein n=1 Tax=Salvia splendens TaxID=180675 RepID=A0A8X9A7K6_SALSN|nr:hypothetical protein SASPL_107741 [Salvia splendens]
MCGKESPVQAQISVLGCSSTRPWPPPSPPPPPFRRPLTKVHVSSSSSSSEAATTKKKEESIFFDGGAHYGDLVANLVLGFTLVWLPLSLAAVFRAFFLRYRFTDVRVTVISGLTGQDRSDFSYEVVKDVQVVPRFIGEWGDVIITLTDATKVDLRSVPNFYPIIIFQRGMAWSVGIGVLVELTRLVYYRILVQNLDLHFVILPAARLPSAISTSALSLIRFLPPRILLLGRHELHIPLQILLQRLG